MTTEHFQRAEVELEIISPEPRVEVTGELWINCVQFLFKREELPDALKHQLNNQI
jgi:hypothetical protein